MARASEENNTEVLADLSPLTPPSEADPSELGIQRKWLYYYEGGLRGMTFELTERYFEMLDAPRKELIWFEESAHFMNVSDPDRFQDVLINKVLSRVRLNRGISLDRHPNRLKFELCCGRNHRHPSSSAP